MQKNGENTKMHINRPNTLTYINKMHRKHKENTQNTLEYIEETAQKIQVKMVSKYHKA